MRILKTKHILYVLLTALIFTSCKTPSYVYKKPSYIYENSGHAISMKKSRNLYKNYKNNIREKVEEIQDNIISRDKKFEGTKYVLVSIQQLESYIQFLKQVEKENKNEVTGIAIFLGAHSKTMEMDSIPMFNSKRKNYENLKQKNDRTGDMRNRISIFLAPTFRDNENKFNDNYNNEFERHIPFYVEYKNPKNVYLGDYKPLLPYLEGEIELTTNALNNSFQRASLVQTINNSNSVIGSTSLNADEFNVMPPKKAN